MSGRRNFIQKYMLGGAAALLAGGFARRAAANGYPVGGVKILVGNTPGSAADLIARVVAKRLSDSWKQSVAIENRVGAGGVIAADAVAKSAGDGYTLLLGQEGALAIAPALQPNLSYDPQRDLLPVVALGETDFVLVANPKTGMRSLADLIGEARKQPGKYTYASAGNGSLHHLAFELLKNRAGIDLVHIPFRGGPLGMNDVIAGQVDVMFIGVAPALAQIQSGRLTALALGGASRNPLLPQVPTVAETFPDFRATTWFALFAPGGTPADVLERINREATQAVREPELRATLAAQGINALGGSALQLAELVREDTRKFAQLARQVRLESN